MQKILSCKSPKEAAMMSGSVPAILLIPRYLMIMGFALLAIYFFKVEMCIRDRSGDLLVEEDVERFDWNWKS